MHPGDARDRLIFANSSHESWLSVVGVLSYIVTSQDLLVDAYYTKCCKHDCFSVNAASGSLGRVKCSGELGELSFFIASCRHSSCDKEKATVVNH